MMADVKPLDCGDNSCLFALERTGMRTNGGCRCLQELHLSTVQRINLERRIRASMHGAWRQGQIFALEWSAHALHKARDCDAACVTIETLVAELEGKRNDRR